MKSRDKLKESSSELDLQTFEELFRLYFPRLRKFAENFLGNKGEAEDLVQDVFVWYWKNKSKLSQNNLNSSYLFTAVRNRCLNVLKRKVIEERYILESTKNAAEELYYLSLTGQSEFISMEDRLLTEMDSIIAKMPDKCQNVFRLKWKEGKKIKEIAEIMGISTTMVDKHISRGLEITRRNIDPNQYPKFYSHIILLSIL